MAGKPYIVWSPDGPTPPKISFKTHQAAHQAAGAMAEKHRGRQFFVMARSGKGFHLPPETPMAEDAAPAAEQVPA